MQKVLYIRQRLRTDFMPFSIEFLLLMLSALSKSLTWEAEELRKLYAESWRQSDVELGLKPPRPGIIAHANAALEESLRAANKIDVIDDSGEDGEPEKKEAEQDDWTNQVWIWFKSLTICACCVRK